MAETAEDVLNVRLQATLGQLEQTMQRGLRVTKTATDGMQSAADRMGQNMRRNANVAASALTEAQQRIGRATGAISDSFRPAAASASAFEEALSMRDAVSRLQASMDPLHAATMRYQSSVTLVEAAVERGTIKQTHANMVLRLAKAQYDATTASIRAMGAAQVGAAGGMTRMLNISGQGRFVLQNTAAQFADIAVQAEMGTSWVRILSQQVPQILGGFGALGGVLGVVAPLLGVVAGVGLPVAAMLYAIGGDAEDTAEKVETFAEKLENATAALNRARDAAQMAGSGGLDQLRERYGQVTTAVVELAQALAEIERRAALASISTALNDTTFVDGLRQQIDSVFGVVGSAVTGAFSGEVEAMRQGIRDLEAEIASMEAADQLVPPRMLQDLALMREELAAAEGRMADLGTLASQIRFDPALLADIAQMQEALTAAVQAGDMSAIADAAKQLREALQATGQEIDQNVLDNLTRVENVARQAVAALEQGEGAANGLGGALGGAAGQAAQLVANLREAASALAGITGAVASLGISNIGDRARVAALEAGQSQLRANAAGRLAEERARLAPALAATAPDGLRAQAERELQALADRLNEQVTLAERIDSLTDTGRSGGGGRRSRDNRGLGEAEIEALQQRINLIGRTDAEIAQLEARYRLLNEARQRGLDLDATQAGSSETVRQQIERQAETIGRLTQEYEQAEQRARFFDDIQGDIKDGILDAIVSGEDLAGTLENVARAFARAALEAALFGSGPLAGIFGGGGGKGGGGGIMSALRGLLSFDGGGDTGNAPRSGGLDGKGGFLAIMHPKERVTDLTQTRSGGRGGAPPVINFAVDARGAQRGVAEEIEARLRQMTPDIVRQSVAATRASYREFP